MANVASLAFDNYIPPWQQLFLAHKKPKTNPQNQTHPLKQEINNKPPGIYPEIFTEFHHNHT